MIYSIEFSIPPIAIQEAAIFKIEPLLVLRNKVLDILDGLSLMREHTLSPHYVNYQATNIPISEVLDYMNGNSGLTEEMIYQNILLSGTRYIVLSSST